MKQKNGKNVKNTTKSNYFVQLTDDCRPLLLGTNAIESIEFHRERVKQIQNQNAN